MRGSWVCGCVPLLCCLGHHVYADLTQTCLPFTAPQPLFAGAPARPSAHRAQCQPRPAAAQHARAGALPRATGGWTWPAYAQLVPVPCHCPLLGVAALVICVTDTMVMLWLVRAAVGPQRAGDQQRRCCPGTGTGRMRLNPSVLPACMHARNTAWNTARNAAWTFAHMINERTAAPTSTQHPLYGT